MTTRTPNPRNLPNLDYKAEAENLGRPPVPIIDVHTHINGSGASAIYRDVMDLFSIDHTYSQTVIGDAPAVRDNLGDRIRFIATPRYNAQDKAEALTTGFLKDIDTWAEDFGSRCVKLWNAPRLVDFSESIAAATGMSIDDIIRLDSPWRRELADRAASHGMMFMTHVADPDTWFATKYADASRYGTKDSHYEALERMLDDYPVPWIAAHMAGSPEDLDRIDGLLSRHPNLLIDTSATKWIVREVSRHTHDRIHWLFKKYKGRILFGSDIVTRDEHLAPASDTAQFASDLASNEAEAFELYASRYWALRTMWETDYQGPSNIADPDLAMVDPDNHSPLDAPRLVGRSLGKDMLTTLYRDAITTTIGAWYESH